MEFSHTQSSFTVTSLGVAEFDTAANAAVERERRDARILVASYARHHGLHDPDEVARFAASCVRRAEQELNSRDGDEAAAPLATMAIRVASQQHVLREASRQTEWVPQHVERSMPPQPLGELVTAASPHFWRRVRMHLTTLFSLSWIRLWLG